WPLVDARAVDCRGRESELGRYRPSLPSSDTRRQPVVYQLLARRGRYSPHRPHDETKAHLPARMEPTLSVADAQGIAGTVFGAWTADHAGRRRGCGPTGNVCASFPMDRRYNR